MDLQHPTQDTLVKRELKYPTGVKSLLFQNICYDSSDLLLKWS